MLLYPVGTGLIEDKPLRTHPFLKSGQLTVDRTFPFGFQAQKDLPNHIEQKTLPRAFGHDGTDISSHEIFSGQYYQWHFLRHSHFSKPAQNIEPQCSRDHYYNSGYPLLLLSTGHSLEPLPETVLLVGSPTACNEKYFFALSDDLPHQAKCHTMRLKPHGTRPASQETSLPTVLSQSPGYRPAHYLVKYPDATGILPILLSSSARHFFAGGPKR